MASASGPRFGAALPPGSPSKTGSLMLSPLPSLIEWSSSIADGTSLTPES